MDLFIRRPGDKTFKIACRLRDELAAASTTRVAPAVAPITAIAPAPATAPPPAAELQRNTDREPGWDLPERRKFRYRLEDIAY